MDLDQEQMKLNAERLRDPSPGNYWMDRVDGFHLVVYVEGISWSYALNARNIKERGPGILANFR